MLGWVLAGLLLGAAPLPAEAARAPDVRARVAPASPERDHRAPARTRPSRGDGFAEQGARHAAEGKYRQALAAYQRAYRLEPSRLDYLNAQALIKNRAGDHAGALKIMTTLIALGPTDPDRGLYLGTRAAMHGKAGEMDAAIADADAAVRLAPDSEIVLRARMQILSNTDRYADAADAAQALLLVKPDDLQALVIRAGMKQRAGRSNETTMAELTAALDALIAAQPNRADLYLERAMRQEKRSAGAAADLDRSIALAPSSQALSLRGELRQARGDMVGAEDDFDAAIGLEPSAAAYQARALFLIRKGDRSAAEGDLAMAVALDPISLARTVLIELMRTRGDTIGVKRHIEVADRLPPTFASLSLRARIHYQAKDYPKAIANAEAAAKLSGRQLIEPTQIISQSWEALGELERAVAAYGPYLAAQPNDPLMLNNRCFLRAKHGVGLDLALADCEAALRLQPNYGPALDSYAFVFLRMGRYPEAIDQYDAALVRMVGNPLVLMGRGIAKRRAGDVAGGDADIAAAKAVFPAVEQTFRDYGVAP